MGGCVSSPSKKDLGLNEGQAPVEEVSTAPKNVEGEAEVAQEKTQEVVEEKEEEAKPEKAEATTEITEAEKEKEDVQVEEIKKEPTVTL